MLFKYKKIRLHIYTNRTTAIKKRIIYVGIDTSVFQWVLMYQLYWQVENTGASVNWNPFGKKRKESEGKLN